MKWVVTFGLVAVAAGLAQMLGVSPALRTALWIAFWLALGLFTMRLLSLLINGR